MYYPSYYPGQCTTLDNVLPWTMYYPGQCTTLYNVLPWTMYYPGQCTTLATTLATTLDNVLPWTMYYPSYYPSYYPGQCTTLATTLAQDLAMSSPLDWDLNHVFEHSSSSFLDQVTYDYHFRSLFSPGRPSAKRLLQCVPGTITLSSHVLKPGRSRNLAHPQNSNTQLDGVPIRNTWLQTVSISSPTWTIGDSVESNNHQMSTAARLQTKIHAYMYVHTKIASFTFQSDKPGVWIIQDQIAHSRLCWQQGLRWKKLSFFDTVVHVLLYIHMYVRMYILYKTI